MTFYNTNVIPAFIAGIQRDIAAKAVSYWNAVSAKLLSLRECSR